MSIYKSDECVDCGQPCRGKACPYKNVLHKECDICGMEVNGTLWKYENTYYCPECLLLALSMDGVIKEADEDEIVG